MGTMWVERDATGNIKGVYANKQPGYAEELLQDNNPSVISFLTLKISDPIDSWDLVSLKIAFNHENRIRALEGKPAAILAQFKAAIRTVYIST